MFVIFSFLEILITALTMQCPKCVFHMDNHIDQVRYVPFVGGKKFQYEIVHQRTCAKNTYFVLAPCGRYQDILHLLQNSRSPWASIITTYLIKLLSTGPLHNFLKVGNSLFIAISYKQVHFLTSYSI